MYIENEEIKAYKSKLKRIRVSRGFTQQELSDLSGINIKSIAVYEQIPEKMNKASLESAANLADCLGCTIEDLLEKEYLKNK